MLRLQAWYRIGLLLMLMVWLPSVQAQDAPLKAVATFSILGDMVRAVGGERVQVTTLVGPDGDAHVYQPSPGDARTIAGADILFVNGFGFEGWLERLVEASGHTGSIVTVTQGVEGLPLNPVVAAPETAHEPHERAEGPAGTVDPHAWQNLANAGIYVNNIHRGLQEADPAGSAVYARNRDAYLQALAALEQRITETLDTLPQDRRKVVTSHDAFGYFAAAYRLEFIAPLGVNTEAEATARDVAALIEQIRAERIGAVFLENMVSPRLLEQIAAESGAKVGGTLYADALSPAVGEAGTYLKMMQHNIDTLYQALTP
ncbi:MAG: metal ABC transporter substrate-binding protein [Thiothrix sp.]|nr:metal ABC transporter substrate-binding protein [Thiothrix sp.]